MGNQLVKGNVRFQSFASGDVLIVVEGYLRAGLKQPRVQAEISMIFIDVFSYFEQTNPYSEETPRVFKTPRASKPFKRWEVDVRRKYLPTGILIVNPSSFCHLRKSTCF